MAFDDSQSVNRALLSNNSYRPNNDRINQSMSSSSTLPKKNNTKWTIRTSISSANLRRYRSPFRRHGINTSSINSPFPPTSSFPLFRHFYLMRSSFKHKRQHVLRNNPTPRDSLTSENSYSAPRIEIRHVIITIFTTMVSAFLLILMIFLDLAYLNDAISNVIDHQMLTTNSTLCIRYPKVCCMKGLVIIVFIGITLILCYSILTLYTRARRHSRLLERKTDELEKEKCLTQKLLHQILPPCVAKELINGRKAPAEYFDSVTVYFSDIVGFTAIARYYFHRIIIYLLYFDSMCSPNETCDMLNQLYSIFDSFLENFDVYKVETIGDAYMVVSGAPVKNGDKVMLSSFFNKVIFFYLLKHPNEIVNMSLTLLRGKQQVRVPSTGAELKLRVGIHTGIYFTLHINEQKNER
jgi:class 3 adenylate cyclase